MRQPRSWAAFSSTAVAASCISDDAMISSSTNLPDAVDAVQAGLHFEFPASSVPNRALLAHDGDGPIAKVRQQPAEFLGNVLAWRQRHFDFRACFGVGIGFGPFVGDEVGFADSPHADGLIGFGEIAVRGR